MLCARLQRASRALRPRHISKCASKQLTSLCRFRSFCTAPGGESEKPSDCTTGFEALLTGAQQSTKKWVKSTVRQPAFERDSLMTIDTPCLVLDLDTFDANLSRMTKLLESLIKSGKGSVRIRPNAKAHKSADIATAQLQAHGKVVGGESGISLMAGIGVDSVYESESIVRSPSNFFSDLSIDDIQLTNVTVDINKMYRLSLLMDHNSKLRFCVICDDQFQVHLWNYVMSEHQNSLLASASYEHVSAKASNTADASGLTKDVIPRFGVVVQLRVDDSDSDKASPFGLDLSKANDKEELVKMCALVTGDYNSTLYLKGVRVNCGNDLSVANAQKAKTTVQNAISVLESELGSAVDISALTVSLAADSASIDEWQRVLTDDSLAIGALFNEIEPGDYVFDSSALRLVASVVNCYERPFKGCRDSESQLKAVNLIDAGSHSFGVGSVPSLVPYSYHPPTYLATDEMGATIDDQMHLLETQSGLEETWSFTHGSGQHGFLTKMEEHSSENIEDDELDVGGRVQLQPTNSTDTVNLHDFIVGIRKDTVEKLWLIDGRSPGN